MAKGKELLRGVSGNKGIAVGKIRIINGDEGKLAQIQVGEIVVASKLEPGKLPIEQYDMHLKKAVAMVQDTGGKTSHGNIVALKTGKPSVCGTQGISGEQATKVLHEGQKVVVDGLAGYDDNGKPYGAIYEWVEGEDAPTTQTVTGPKAAPNASVTSAMDAIRAKYGFKSKG